MAPNPDHAGWKSGKDLGFSGGITNNVAVGNHAVTKSSSSVAIGDNSSSQGYRSVAVGADSQAGDTTDTADHNDGISAVAVGDGAKAMGNGSIATGKVLMRMVMLLLPMEPMQALIRHGRLLSVKMQRSVIGRMRLMIRSV